MAYEGMIAETISINGDKGEPISAYVARPLGAGPFPGMVLLHHAPGWARCRSIGERSARGTVYEPLDSSTAAVIVFGYRKKGSDDGL